MSGGIPNAALNIIVWRAPFACTVTNVRGYRVGGTGATINARRNGTLNHLASALSVSSADTWMDGGAVSNTAYAAGDKLEIMIVTTTGTRLPAPNDSTTSSGTTMPTLLPPVGARVVRKVEELWR